LQAVNWQLDRASPEYQGLVSFSPSPLPSSGPGPHNLWERRMFAGVAAREVGGWGKAESFAFLAVPSAGSYWPLRMVLNFTVN
jgi:hypothetical protein